MVPETSEASAPVYALLHDSLTDEHELGVVRGALAAAREARATLLCIPGGGVDDPAPHGSARNFVFDLARASGVRGVLALSGALGNAIGPERLSAWLARFQPLPICAAGVALGPYPSVSVDNASGTRAAVQHLLHVHGKRRIAFIRGPAASEEAEARLSAYREALVSEGIPVEERWIVPGDYDIASGAHGIVTLLDERKVSIHSLDGLVAANDCMALGALDELRNRGVDVPGQLALVGFDDIQSARVARPALTTVRQPSEQMGREAFRRLLGMSDAGASGSRVLPTELVVRNSCGCVETSLDLTRRSELPSLGLGFEAAFLRQRQLIASELARSARGRFGGAGANWESLWIGALLDELRGREPGGLVRKVQQSLRAIERRGGDLSPVQEVLAVLRHQALPCAGADSAVRGQIEEILHDAQVAVGAIVAQSAAASARHVSDRHRPFRRRMQSLMFGDVRELSQVTAEELPALGVEACVVARLRAPDALGRDVELLFGFGPQGQRVSPELQSSQALIAHPVFKNAGTALFALPVTFLDQPLGFAVLSVAAADGPLHEELREVLSTVLKVLSLGGAR
jgi:DNA-binding LacI/PurR family transcriptional regulator